MTCPVSRYTMTFTSAAAAGRALEEPRHRLNIKQMACCSSSLENIGEEERKKGQSEAGPAWSTAGHVRLCLCCSFAVNGADANVISTSLHSSGFSSAWRRDGRRQACNNFRLHIRVRTSPLAAADLYKRYTVGRQPTSRQRLCLCI